jgi:exodeoxyribonuclease VII large subunit
MRSTLWSADYQRINRHFLQVVKQPLGDGILLLMEVSIQFEANYGLSLMIHDIDPSFTLGDLEREKQETIQKLQQHGVFTQNKKLEIPLLPKRIAVISVSTSKGFADFEKIIQARMKGFTLQYHLFPSLLQGPQAVEQIKQQLNTISNLKKHFDVVAIIRGGGGEVGLASFNDYSLAYSIATFPMPVITGIGHATNQTVSEMVAHTNAITPSELADLLLNRFEVFRDSLNDYTFRLRQVLRKTRDENKHLKYFVERLSTQSVKFLQGTKQQFQELWQAINRQTMNRCKLENKALNDINALIYFQSRKRISKEHEQLFGLQRNLTADVAGFFLNNKTQLDFNAKTVSLLDPVNVLRRGYSITYSEGKLVTSIKKVKPGASIKTILQDGELISTINEKS